MFWSFVLKIIPKQFSFFLLFLTFLIDFQLLCSLAVLVVSPQVLNDLNRFGRVQSKNVFYDEHFFLAAYSWQCLPFFERLKLTFSSFGRFWPIFGFCAVWPYFLLLSKFDLRRFCTTLIKNQFSSKRGFCCVLGTFVIKITFVMTRILWTNYLKTHFFWSLVMKTISKWFSVCSPVFDVYLVFLAIWPYCLFFGHF